MNIPITTRKQGALVGITGSIGSGKSAVCKILQKKGYTVFSADKFARELTDRGSPALLEIQKKLGDEFFHADGTLNRKKMREEITRFPHLRKALEGILHPKIQAKTQEETQKCFTSGQRIVFYEAPLLFEAMADESMDCVLCIWAPVDVLLKRIVDRDHVTREQAQELLKTQWPQQEKIQRSKFSIENSEDLLELEEKVDSFLQELLKTLPLKS